MPSSIKLTEPLDILVEYGYLDEDKPYHKALSNAVVDFGEDPSLGGEYNKDYLMLLQDEAKKELKLRRKKIDVKSFKENFLNKEEEPVKADTKGTRSIPAAPAPDLSVEKKEDEETEGLKGIRDVLDDILKVLRLDFKSDRKDAREARKNAAAQMRKDKEDKLESEKGKGKFGVGKAVKAMVAPFMSIWEKLLNFLKLTFIGVLFNTVFKWFSNPENEKKVKAIGKFFKDWWPALSFAAIAFLTPFGALVAGAVSLLTAIIPKIIMAIAANPWSALALVGTGLAVWGISKLASQPDETTEEVDESVDEIGKEETIDQLKEEQENRGFMGKIGDFFTGAGAEREQQIERLQGMDNEGGSDGFSDVKAEQNMGTFTGDGFMKEFEGTPGFQGGEQEFNQGGMVHNFNQVNSARNIVKKYNEGGLVNNYNYGGGQVQNFNLGGIVQKYNEGGIVQKYNEGGIVQKYNQGGLVQKYNQGGLVRNYNNVVKNYKQGGFVSGPGGVDKVPARLTAGEFVMSKGAVQKFGTNTLASMNAAGGGSNIPTITQEYMGGGSVQYFAGGGRVESTTTKEPVEIPQLQSRNRTITLPTIKKKGEEQRNTTKNDIPEFRIPIISTQRSMILSSLGIQDLIGGE